MRNSQRDYYVMNTGPCKVDFDSILEAHFALSSSALRLPE